MAPEYADDTAHTQQDESTVDEYEQPVNERERSGGTSASTWIAVFGSSTVFHVLLLILLGMIIISQPDDEQEEVTLQIPEEEEEEQEEITRREVEQEVEQETEVTNPTVETTEQVSEVESEMQAETGQSMDFQSDTTNNSPAERSIALGGGGGGGTYGNRGGAGLSNSGGGGSAKTQRAVEAALKWLAKHQNEDGYWETEKYIEQCPEGNQCHVFAGPRGSDNTHVGITGLSLLAFLGAGYTHESDKKLGGIDVGKMMLKSLRWLKQRQKDNGAFDGSKKQMYNHAITTMAYVEAFGMTGDPKLKPIAQQAVDFLEHAQNTIDGKRLAWRYQANDGENDTSVTGWCAMALKSADLAGLDTSKKSMQGALRWVEKVTNKQGITGYRDKITSRSGVIRHASLTPVGMMVRMFAHEELNEKQVKRLKQGAKVTANRPPKYEGETEPGFYNDEAIDFYYWYYGSLALFMFAGPDTPFEELGYWQKWNEPMKRAVLTSQQKARDGHEVGSWDAISKWAKRGGRVYTTALNTLTLEVYYRYDNALFQ